MVIKLPKNSNVLKFPARSITIRTDIFKFVNNNLQLISEAGVPSGMWDLGTMFFNMADRKIYLSSNFKRDNIPDVLWAKLDSNANDFSGNLYHGTQEGSPEFSIAINGKGITLDASNDKITWGALGDQRIAGGGGTLPFCLSFWIKSSDFTLDGDEAYIFTRYNDANNYLEIILQRVGGVLTIIARMRSTGQAQSEETITTINDDEWTFILLSASGSAGTSATYKYANGTWSSNLLWYPDYNPTFVGTENYLSGYSDLNSSFGDHAIMIDDLKFWSTFRSTQDQRRIDKSNLDGNYWIEIQTIVSP